MRTDERSLDPCGGRDSEFTGCSRPALERLRFWNGRFLVARDLRHMQDDLIRRIEYHQSFAHGEGVLCGFSLREHPREECRKEWVVLGSGMGYTCCGDTLWMPRDRAVEIPGASPEDADRDDDAGAGEEGPRPEWFLVACPIQRPTDPTPALYSEDPCEPIRHEHGRLREEVELRVVPAETVLEECWPRRRAVTEVDCTEAYEDDCEQPLGEAPPCERRCPCGECLVLAALWRDAESGEIRWDTTHRKVLAPDRDLTRITGTSWPHGGEMSIEDLKDQDGRLVVRFSRPLRPADDLRNGINAMTFEVSYLGSTGTVEHILPSEQENEGVDRMPRLSQNRRCAIFNIPDWMFGRPIKISDCYIRIRLLCDFLIDCHGRAVSGAHIAGDAGGRGSGNGVQGGVFESWFYVTG